MARRKVHPEEVSTTVDMRVLSPGPITIIEESLLPEGAEAQQQPSSAAALVPAHTPPASPAGGTLYELLQEMRALWDTEALVPEEQRAAFLADLAAAGERAVQKIDNCIRFERALHADIHVVIAEANTHEAEIERLKQRGAQLAAMLDRFHATVMRAMTNAKVTRLDGRIGKLWLQKNPGSVEVQDEAVVPLDCKRVTLKLRGDEYRHLLDVLDNIGSGLSESLPRVASFAVDKPSVKRLIEAGHDVPGADLIFGEDRLEVR